MPRCVGEMLRLKCERKSKLVMVIGGLSSQHIQKDLEASLARMLYLPSRGRVTRGDALFEVRQRRMAQKMHWPRVEQEEEDLRIQQTMDWLMHHAATWLCWMLHVHLMTRR